MGVKIPNCFICLDKGYVTYNKECYTFFSHCTCPQGNKYHYKGWECTQNKSDFYVPSVAEVFDPVLLAQGNFKKWYSWHKDKPYIQEQLNKRWQELKEGGADNGKNTSERAG